MHIVTTSHSRADRPTDVSHYISADASVIEAYDMSQPLYNVVTRVLLKCRPETLHQGSKIGPVTGALVRSFVFPRPFVGWGVVRGPSLGFYFDVWPFEWTRRAAAKRCTPRKSNQDIVLGTS